MLFSVLLMLLLVVSGTEAGFHGLVLTYTSKRIVGSGPMVFRNVKLSFSTCTEADSWICGSGPGPCAHTVEENAGYWCQKSWSSPQTGYTSSTAFWYSRNWVSNKNGVVSWKALVYNELRIRSDIGKPNSTPQTTTIPLVRFPSNCQRNISLLRFDPDGDVVRCRFAEYSLGECNDCTPPSVLSLSSSCTLWFSPTSSSNQGEYAVQLMMEDFPRQNITMTDSSNLQELITTSDFITKIPIQFLFQVHPAVPSCTEGLYLPRFLPPTPEHRAQIYITAKETLQIAIRAEATQSQIFNLFFSGPYNMVKNTSRTGSYTLTWTPLDSQDNETHPICFLVETSIIKWMQIQELFWSLRNFPNCVGAIDGKHISVDAPANSGSPFYKVKAICDASYSGYVYQSEQRCVVVTVRPHHVFHLKMKIATTLSLVNDKEIIQNAIKDELVRRGMASSIRVRLLGGDLVEVRTPIPPSG